MEYTETPQQPIQPQGYTNPGTPTQVELPNATLILVFGILSIVFCGLIGIGLGITALIMSNKAREEFAHNPGKYTTGSYSNMNGGRICGIIGLVLSSIVMVFVIIYVIVIFAALGGLAAGSGSWV